MNLETIKARIAKLLAKAEGTTNEFEAASFMAKVNELLEEHQIEMHEIRSTSTDNDPMGKQDGETNLYASIKWARDVAGALARYYGCRFVYWRRGNHFTYQIVGRESARMTFEIMLPFVITQVKLQAKALHQRIGFATTKTLSVWEREVGQALYMRIWGLVPKAEERRDELSKNALVPVNDVDAFMDAAFGELKKGKSVKLSYGHAAREAAEKVSLNVQTTQAKTKRIA